MLSTNPSAQLAPVVGGIFVISARVGPLHAASPRGAAGVVLAVRRIAVRLDLNASTPLRSSSTTT